MTKKLIVSFGSDSLYDAFVKMTKNNISHLPVVEKDNPMKLIGIVTFHDIAINYDLLK